MITPNLLYITKKDFDRLVLEAEENFLEERSNYKPEERESCVQFWVHIPHALVPINYLRELETSYRNAGWKTVKVEYQKDRTESIYIYLSM